MLVLVLVVREHLTTNPPGLAGFALAVWSSQPATPALKSTSSLCRSLLPDIMACLCRSHSHTDFMPHQRLHRWTGEPSDISWCCFS